jgi:adenylate kinase family enzyme
VSDEVSEIEEIWIEAEDNKEKILFSEENTIKANKLLEEWEKYILWESLDELLGEDVDLVWDNFIKRNIKINSWILNQSDNTSEGEDDNEEEIEVDLEEYYEELKNEFEHLEKKKNKLFLEWNYDVLDDINDELLEIIVKLEKVSKILWLEE